MNKQGEVGCAEIIGSGKNPPQFSYINDSGFNVYNGSAMIEMIE